MALESGTYISDLVVTNPTAPDGLNQGDDHLRLIKATIKNTFPNITGAVSKTHTQINAAVDATENGAAVLADAGAFFKTNTTDGVTNPVAGEVDIKVAGTSRLKVKSDGTITAVGTLSATAFSGPGHVPVGGSMPWFSNTLPDATANGTYAWINGQAVSRTTYSTLFAILGTTYGTGDGSTTFNLPDLQEVALYGRSTMGGAASPSRITNYVMTALGTIIGACTHLLTTGEMPSHTHTATSTDSGHTHGISGIALPSSQGAADGGNLLCVNGSTTTAVGNAVITTTNANTGGGGVHDNVSPGMAVNWVMRIA